MNVRFLKTAQIELDECFDYYEEQIEGLGHDFIMEVLATEGIIEKNKDYYEFADPMYKKFIKNNL